jgi:hypothetical protein
MNHNNTYYIARGLLTVALALSLLLSIASQGKSYTGEVPRQADSDILRQHAVQFWQRINAARQDPLAEAQRLEISEHVVRSAFATQEWVLDQGLPPLAWSDELAASASAHGRDMFNRVYYSYVSPEGSTYWDRIEATGYTPTEAGETMNAMFFENLIPVAEGLDILVDTILRDELSGNTSVERNIFSPAMTQVGAGFFAESIPLLGDQPYGYLLIADFASPQQAQSYVIGSYPEDCSVVMHPLISGGWFQVRSAEDTPDLPSGIFQIALPPGGADFVIVSNNGLGEAVGYTTVFPQPPAEENIAPNITVTIARNNPGQQ